MTQDLVPGSRFNLYRESDTTPGTYEFVAEGVTLKFGRTNTFDDATVADTATPTNRPQRKSVKKLTTWSLNFSGKADPVRYAKLERDFEAEDPHNYRVAFDMAAAKGGRSYTGLVHFETLELDKNEQGVVTFSSQTRGEGAYVTQAAAA